MLDVRVICARDDDLPGTPAGTSHGKFNGSRLCQKRCFCSICDTPWFFHFLFFLELEKDDDSVSSFHEFRHPAYRQRSSSLPASLFGILSLPSIMSSHLCFTSAPLLYLFPVSAPYHRPPTTIHFEDVANAKTLQPIHLHCADLPTKANTFSPIEMPSSTHILLALLAREAAFCNIGSTAIFFLPVTYLT